MVGAILVAMKAALLTLALLLTLSGCGNDKPTTKAPPVTTSPYEQYQAIVKDTEGADLISRSDAATRAALLCASDDIEGQYLGGVPLTEFPTDLALVRAYCPDKAPPT